MIVVIHNTKTGHREVATGVTRVEEKPVPKHRTVHSNILLMFADEVLIGEVYTNDNKVEILPNG